MLVWTRPRQLDAHSQLISYAAHTQIWSLLTNPDRSCNWKCLAERVANPVAETELGRPRCVCFLPVWFGPLISSGLGALGPFSSLWSLVKLLWQAALAALFACWFVWRFSGWLSHPSVAAAAAAAVKTVRFILVVVVFFFLLLMKRSVAGGRIYKIIRGLCR